MNNLQLSSRMHEDLRRRALESRKTVSRKARSLQSSTTTSRLGSGPNSRSASQVASRDVSDDEDGGDFSDGGAWSTASIDGVLSGAEDEPGLNWQEELAVRITRILDRNRKGGSAAGREEDLSFYVSVLRGRYGKTQIMTQLADLYAAFIKSIKGDSSERETLLALEAISITTITDPNTQEGFAYEACNKTVQNLIHDSESFKVKQGAIQTLSLVTFFSSDPETMEDEIMPLLASIVESDGAQISADDSAEVVAAAIDAWSLLVTLLDDAQDVTAQTIDALVDQLSSSQTTVQIAAGEAIALLYEKSYTEVESDEDVSDDDDDGGGPRREPMIQRYEPFRRKDELLTTVASLSKVSTKSRSKQDRKDLHSSFADVLKSVENPRLGPRYSDAIDQETGKHYGSRLSIKVGPNSKMLIDKWWKLVRLRALRRWLKGGFLEHHQKNEVVLEMLPVLTRS